MSKAKKLPTLPTDKRVKSDKAYWSTTFTAGDASIYAFERVDRGGVVWVKYRPLLPAGITGRREEVKRVLPPGGQRVRTASGRLDLESVRLIGRLVQNAVARLSLGEADPFVVTPPPPGAMTISRGFDLALAAERGKYATDTRRKEEVARARNRIEAILGTHTLWTAVDTSAVIHLWRHLAREYKRANDRSRACGARQTEVTVDALFTIGRWLEEHGHLPRGTVQRPDKWRKLLKDEWLEITKERAEKSQDEQPRHSEEELQQIFAALGDPRRRLFQLLRDVLPEMALAGAMRSGLELNDAEQPVALTVHWLRGRRTKGLPRAAWETEPAAQRATLDAYARSAVAGALVGYLRSLEQAWREGRLADYPLFPDAPLSGGVVVAEGLPVALRLEAASVLTIDPRFELAFELGGEQRMGQVICSMRSHMVLPGVDDKRVTSKTPTYGDVTPPSARKKPAHPIALTSTQRAWIDEVLAHGYLRDLEAEYRAGRLSDYPLFPQGRLVRGRATVAVDGEPLTRAAALVFFHELERVAGIAPLEGRGWNGVRRVAADRLEDVETDERVQNTVAGNSLGTRRSKYQLQKRRKTLERSIAARQRIRGRIAPIESGPTTPVRAGASAIPDAVRAAVQKAGLTVTAEQLAALAAALTAPDGSPTLTEA